MEKNLKTVKEVSCISGVSRRTLHYYDEIGLLKPALYSDSGYRLYDDESLIRLQRILLFRELEFSLNDIKRIIDNPDFDLDQALDVKIKLLEMNRDHFDNLICLAKRLKLKGNMDMSFKEFDRSKIEAYQSLAKEIWGDTDAYKEYEEKMEELSDVSKRETSEKFMDIFYEFGEIKYLSPSDEKVQNQVRKLQKFITDNYYHCTNDILQGLGKLYNAGGEMTDNIDVAGGKGCALFVSEAIDIYCR